MNIAIWGTKKEALYLQKKIECDQQNEVVCFVDNDKEQQGKCIENKPVYSFKQLREMYPVQVDGVILALRNGYSIASIIKQLQNAGIKNVGLMKPSAFDYKEEIKLNDISGQILWMDTDTLTKPLFPYLQIILIKTCNLNCKGCTHFANLYNKKQGKTDIYQIQELEDDMKKLSEKADIFRLRLLGGEPLLYPYLKEAMTFSQKYFPHADIRIVTNGLLILKASEELFHCIYNNRIGVDVSLYQPTMKIKNEIEKKLQEFNLNYGFGDIGDKGIEKFEKNIDISGENDPQKAMDRCHSKQCLTLLDGKLFKCPFEALGDEFFNYFSIYNVCRKGYDLRDRGFNEAYIFDNLYLRPVDMCKYCAEEVGYFDWENTFDPQPSDWMV